METTKLSSKGQVIIPKTLRSARRWQAGLELEVVETEEGLLLRPKVPFQETSLDEVAGCLTYVGPPKSDGDIEASMRQAARSAWHDRS